MNFFGKKSGHFGEEDGFYDPSVPAEALEEVQEVLMVLGDREDRISVLDFTVLIIMAVEDVSEDC